MLCGCPRLCAFTLILTPASPLLFLDYLHRKGGVQKWGFSLVSNWGPPAPQTTVHPCHATLPSLQGQQFRTHRRPASMTSLDLVHFLHFLLGFVGLGRVRVLTVTSVPSRSHCLYVPVHLFFMHTHMLCKTYHSLHTYFKEKRPFFFKFGSSCVLWVSGFWGKK